MVHASREAINYLVGMAIGRTAEPGAYGPASTETNQEIIKDWLIAQGTVDASVTPIWSFAPIPQPVEVVFESSPEARSLVGASTRIRHVGEAQNGFALYSVSMR